MAMNQKIPKNFDGYMRRFPAAVRSLLKKMRLTVKKAAPQAEEKISYGMPVFVSGKSRVYFGAFQNHIGFFPGTTPIAAFRKDLSKYKCSKGTVRFPLDQPLPLGTITRMVKFQMKKVLIQTKK